MDTNFVDKTIPGVGHNEPPADFDTITARLSEDHQSVLARRDELETALERVPGVIEDDETAQKCADFIKQCAAAIKNADKIRVEEKEPYLEGGRRVDGFFKGNIIERIDTVKKAVTARLTEYQRRKEVEERRRRQEEEKRAQEAAAAARRELDERIAALEDVDYENWDDDALLAVYERKVGPLPTNSDRPSLIDGLRKQGDAAVQSAIDAENEAKRRSAEAERVARTADASAADISRTRSTHGSVASLRTEWKFKDLDRGQIDLEALRAHLPQSALEQAVRSWIKANAANDLDLDAGRQPLRGVEIYKDYVSVVR